MASVGIQTSLSLSPESQRLLSGSGQPGASAVNKLALCLLAEASGHPPQRRVA